MAPRPVSPDLLPDLLADAIVARSPGSPVRVAIDGAPCATPEALADAVAERLRVHGRAPTRIDTAFFLRPASLRLERGRTDPVAYYEDWLDVDGLRREVLDPTGPDGTNRIVPSLRDPVTDRATRAPYVDIPSGAVILVSGALLLGHGLPFDLTVHLRQSAATLARRTAPELEWRLPAFARYDAEVAPSAHADVVILTDDPRHPAVITR